MDLLQVFVVPLNRLADGSSHHALFELGNFAAEDLLEVLGGIDDMGELEPDLRAE
jgi:hypothetical protein